MNFNHFINCKVTSKNTTMETNLHELHVEKVGLEAKAQWQDACYSASLRLSRHKFVATHIYMRAKIWFCFVFF
jgi:hypothetical protein